MMNKNNYKLLIEGWRGFLNEISVNITGINKIKEMVDNLYEIRQGSGRDIKIVVERKEKDIVVSLLNLDGESSNDHVFFKRVADNPHAKLGNKKVVVKDNDGGSREAWQIMWSEAGGGYGPLLYEIGIEVISCRLNGAVMSDRGSVSDEARNVWARYKQRADSEFNLTSVKMDVSDASLEDFSLVSDFDPENMKKMTPDDPTDDMYQYSALMDMLDLDDIKTDWREVESPLAYAFYKNKPEVIEYMENKSQVSDFDLDFTKLLGEDPELISIEI
jgi:hypothetical protein